MLLPNEPSENTSQVGDLKAWSTFEGKDVQKSSTGEGSFKSHTYDVNVVKMH